MKTSDNRIMFAHPQIYVDKIVPNSFDDIELNSAYLLYTPHSGIMVCDRRVIDTINMCKENNTFFEVVNAIDSDNSDVERIIEYLVKKRILSAGSPIVPFHTTSDALMSSEDSTYGFWIHITNNCNLKCKYCYIDKDNTTTSISSLETTINSIIESATRHAAQKIIFKISGGEPLTCFSIVEHLVNYVHKLCRTKKNLSVHFELLTNGTIISKQILSFIKKNNISVSVSLDTVKESEDEARIFVDGKGSSEIVKKNIDTFIANGIFPRIMVTINSKNQSQLPQLTEYLIEKKLHFRFSLEKDCTGTLPKVISNSSELIKYLDDCFDIMEKAILNHNYNWQFKFNNVRFKTFRERSCSAGTHFFAVGANGEFASCGLGLSQKTHYVAPEDDLIDSLQCIHHDFFKKNTRCQECCWSSCCANDCPIQSKSVISNNGISPFCNILQFVIPRLMKLEALRLYMRYNSKI